MAKLETIERWKTEVRAAGYEINDFAEVKVNCTRCGGSGRFAFNPIHGTVCLGCHGHRYSMQPVGMVAKRLRNRANAARRREAAKVARRSESVTKGREYLGANPEVLAAFAGSKNTFIRSVARKLMQYGSISEAQSVAVINARIGEEAYAAKVVESAERSTPIPESITEGRTRVEGIVTSAKWKETQWGDSLRITMTIVTEEGGEYRLNGSMPQAITDALLAEDPAADEGASVIGKTIAFDARVSASDRDTDFGFFNRPTKAAIVAA